MNTLGLSTCLVLASVLCALTGCKRAAAPNAAQSQSPGEPSLPSPGDARRQPPSMAELSNFIRSHLPSLLKLAAMKNDPPVPMPNTSPGSNAWLINVRLTFAPVEDELGAPASKDAQAFKAMVEELNGLVAWSQAYAQSPYVSLYPGFTLNPLTPASPQLLAVIQHKDRPFAPVYGKMGAEWQVDHWVFTVEDLTLPEDNGRFRSSFTGPFLVQGEPATTSFVAAAKAAIAEAKPKKNAIERAYRNDLLKATQPGTLYQGKMSYRGKTMPAEVRFTTPPGGDPGLAQFELRLPASGYVYFCSAKLAKGVPRMPVPAARIDEYGFQKVEPETKDDLTVNYERVTEPPMFNTADYPASEFRYAYQDAKDVPVSLRNHQLEGKMALANPPLPGIVLSAQQSP